MTVFSISEKIRAGLNECARNQLAIPATRHVFGPSGIGVDAAVQRLVDTGFDPPNDPTWFSAALACSHLGGEVVKPPSELRCVLALIAKIRLEQQREASRVLAMARLYHNDTNAWRTRG